MISHLVLFGATGDLAGRFLLPALAELEHANLLPEDFKITATANNQLDEPGFRAHAESRLNTFAKHLPKVANQMVIQRIQYRMSDATSMQDIQRLIDEETTEATLYYLALHPEIVPQTITALAASDMHPDSKIAIEKPFGRDLQGATELAELLTKLFGGEAEHKIFNVDHVLGRASVQALTNLRSANPMIEAVWNSDYIEEFNILWEETLALEGRVDFYDTTGALKDVMQNHLMQVLAVSTMDLPENLLNDDSAQHAQRQRKLDLLKAVRPPSRNEAVQNSRRGRYTAGTLSTDSTAFGEVVEGYLDVDGVEASRATETFAEVLLTIDTSRWSGTRFRLRTGKALAKLRKGIEIVFRTIDDDVPPAKMWIGLNGPHTVELRLNTIDAHGQPATVELSGPQPVSQASPYANVLKNCLEGGSELSVSTEEAILAWQILTPFLEAWHHGEVAMETYTAGSTPPYWET